MRASASKMPTRWVAATILIGTTAFVVALRLIAPATAAPTRAVVPQPTPVVASKAPAPAPASSPASAALAKAPAPLPGPLIIGRVLDTGGPIRYGSYFWDEAGVPAGPLTITVDLKAGVLSVFRGGDEIGTTAVIYGADGLDTPLGTFPILQKDRHHFSSTYHHAPMPYTLRLTGDGVSIHGSRIAADYATHGCIGVPVGFAAKLFEVAKVGDRVIVTRQGLRRDAGKPNLIVG